MAFEWFTILNSFALDSQPVPNELLSETEWRMLEDGYISQIRIISDRQLDLRVDGFPLFYELLNSIAQFVASGRFRVEVGEGLRLHGTPDGPDVSVSLTDEVGGNTLVQRRLSRSNVSLFLCVKISELAHSLEKLGLDPEACVAKWPPEYFAHR